MADPNDDLGRLLEASRPDPFEYDATVHTHVRAVSLAAEAEIARERSRVAWWRRPRPLIGAFAVLLVGTAGGAMAVQLNITDPLDDDPTGTPDVQVPMAYETVNGDVVQCPIDLYVQEGTSDAEVKELESFVINHDWTDFGQRLYQEAVQDKSAREPDNDITDEQQQSAVDDVLSNFDKQSFQRATLEALNDEIPLELRPDGMAGSMPAECGSELP